MGTYLDLIDINPLVLLLHFLICHAHRIYRSHLERQLTRPFTEACTRAGLLVMQACARLLICLARAREGLTYGILQVLRCHRRLLHVESLLLKLHQLTLVHAFLLECSERPLLDGGLLWVSYAV